jgi:TIR domain
LESKQSNGEITETFLRGAGLPEQFIIYLKSLAGTALDFCSCFISYSTQDQEFADLLYADLQNNGVRCWFAPHDIQGGKKIHDQIDEAIRVYDRLLLILSEHSMKSLWVKTEQDKKKAEKAVRFCSLSALFLMRKFERKLFDADLGDDSTREVRKYFIGTDH